MRGRGFTLIEAVVAIVILVILTGVIVPRLVGVGSRRAAESVQRVADVLSAAALRQELTSDRLAVEFDSESRSLLVQTLTRASGAPAAEWRPSPLIPGIVLEGIELRAVSVGLVALDPAKWRVELARSQQRPRILVEAAEPGGDVFWTILLEPAAMRCTVVSPGQPIPDSGEVDLDRQGGGNDAW